MSIQISTWLYNMIFNKKYINSIENDLVNYKLNSHLIVLKYK